MTYIIAGLGNPGQEYQNTRHNTGRIVLNNFINSLSKSGEDISEFKLDKKTNALISKADIYGKKAVFVMPETFMNNSGKALRLMFKVKAGKKNEPKKTANDLIVIYDDFNLPLGKIRISYNRSSGGHNGLESIIKSIGTEAFIRIRIGVSPEKSDGLAKVPHGEQNIEKFILGQFKEVEMAELKKVSKKVGEAIEIIIKEGREKAMSVCN